MNTERRQLELNNSRTRVVVDGSVMQITCAAMHMAFHTGETVNVYFPKDADGCAWTDDTYGDWGSISAPDYKTLERWQADYGMAMEAA